MRGVAIDEEGCKDRNHERYHEARQQDPVVSGHYTRGAKGRDGNS